MCVYNFVHMNKRDTRTGVSLYFRCYQNGEKEKRKKDIQKRRGGFLAGAFVGIVCKSPYLGHKRHSFI